MSYYFVSFSSKERPLVFDLSAHQVFSLTGLIEEIIVELQQFFDTPRWMTHPKYEYLRKDWEKEYLNHPLIEKLLPYFSLYPERYDMSPHNINLLYQVLTGEEPLKNFPEALLYYGRLYTPEQVPYWTPHPINELDRPIPISQLRDEGVEILNEAALRQRLNLK